VPWYLPCSAYNHCFLFLWQLIPTAWWTAIAHAHLAPRAPGSNLVVRVNRGIDDQPGIQQEAICYQWSKQQLILSVSEPSISQRSQIKEDTVEPSVLARKFNLKAYAAITWHNDPASPASNPDLPITVARQRVPYREATNSATEAGKWLMTLIISNWHYIMYIYILRPTHAGGPGPQSFIGNLWYKLLFSCKTLRKNSNWLCFLRVMQENKSECFFLNTV